MNNNASHTNKGAAEGKMPFSRQSALEKRIRAGANDDLLALRTLDLWREAAYMRGDVRTRVPSSSKGRQAHKELEPIGDEVWSPGPGWGDVGSGPRPSRRDPRPIGQLLERYISDMGWKQKVDVASVVVRWPEIVGPVVAQNCVVEEFSDDGVLRLRASSTSWASNLRTLTAGIEARIAQELGENVVKEIVVKGPESPSWNHGRLRVKGRGPRDTYG